MIYLQWHGMVLHCELARAPVISTRIFEERVRVEFVACALVATQSGFSSALLIISDTQTSKLPLIV